MLWQKKKKRKKATKPKAVAQTAAPQQPVEEIPQTTEPEKKEETPKQKKPAGKKSKKVLTPEKAFLEAFGRLTNRHRYQNHLLVVAQDIDETVALMCYIQLSLLGVAGYVKVGNSLTEPMTDNDNKENYWFTPMYFSNVWVLRRIFGGH